MTVSVLFVCAGNICRSPMAEAVFRQKVVAAGLADAIAVDSAGTGSWHVGQAPHQGTQAILRRNGIPVDGMVARRILRSDLERFDFLVVMDGENYEDVQDLVRRSSTDSVILRLLDYANPDVTQGRRDVPDPYYSGGFDLVYRLVDSACAGLLAHLRETCRL